MGSSEVWDEATASAYEATSKEMFAPEVLDPTVEFLLELADGGPVLELAIGTGRVAVPLRERGVRVSGIELSPHMVAQLRRRADEATIPVVVGDMTTSLVPGRFRLAYLVWNSLSNLRTQREQAECFGNAARHLALGGRFVIELWVPRTSGDAPVVSHFSEDHVCVDTYDVSTQACASHHFFREPDGRYRGSVGHFRYAWPDECDLFAQLAGLEFEARFGDWDRRPFKATSEKHVSVWRKPVA